MYRKNNEISKAFEILLPVLVNAAKRAVINNERYGDESALGIFMKAYNAMQEDEFDGNWYIFNLNDKDDLKFLVDHEMVNAGEIADLYHKCNASGLFWYTLDCNGCPTGEVEAITLDKLKEILCNNMEMLMRCILMYGNHGGSYKKVYSMLITDNLVESDFSVLW